MAIYTTEMLKARLNGGAKTDKFGVMFRNPQGAPELGFKDEDYCLITGFAFPSRRVGTIDAWVQGRKLVLPGDTDFGNEWRVTLYNPLNHDMRQKIMDWQKKIDDYESNTHADMLWTLTTEAVIFQLNGAGEKTAQYVVKNIFPKEVGEVEVKGSEQNQIQSFTATFAMSSMEIIK